jgi:hypothetical protein
MASCITDDKIGNLDPDSEMLTIQIAVPRAGGPDSSATRALGATDEFAVNEVAVLAFNSVSGVKKFYGRYVGFVTDGPDQISNTAGATMTFQVTIPEGEFDLMVMVNANKLLDNANLSQSMDMNAVAAAIKTSMTTAGWQDNTSAADYRRMPMWGYRSGVKIPEDFTGTNNLINTPFNLTRMVAKVDIALGQTLISATKFELKSVRVYNYVEQGRLVPDISTAANSALWEGITQTTLANLTTPTLPSSPTKADSTNEFIDRTVTDNKSLTGSIYLFEAPAGCGPVANKTEYLKNTCLVIGGKYKGGAETFYRIDFVENNAYIPLIRNHSYRVTVTDISGNGHPTEDEALNSVPVNIDTDILDWNEHDTSVEGSNGIYKLKVSHREYTLSSAAYNAASTDNILTVTTDYSGGWTASVWDDEAGTTACSWLTLSQTGQSAANTPNGTTLRLLCGAASVQRTAYVHVTAGAVKLKIKVSQTFTKGIRFFDSTGTEITALDFASRRSLINATPTPQQVRVVWEPAGMPLTVAKTTATGATAFDWKTNNIITAAPPITLPAGGSYTMSFNPPGITTAQVAADPFFEKASTLTFTLDATTKADLATKQTHYDIIPEPNAPQQSLVPMAIIGFAYGQAGSVKVKSNTSWEVKSYSDPSTIFSTPFDHLQNEPLGNKSGTPLTFSIWPQAPFNATKDGKVATVVLTDPTGRADDRTIKINAYYCGANNVSYTKRIGNTNSYETHMYLGRCYMVQNSIEGKYTYRYFENDPAKDKGAYYSYANRESGCPAGWHLINKVSGGEDGSLYHSFLLGETIGRKWWTGPDAYASTFGGYALDWYDEIEWETGYNPGRDGGGWWLYTGGNGNVMMGRENETTMSYPPFASQNYTPYFSVRCIQDYQQ